MKIYNHNIKNVFRNNNFDAARRSERERSLKEIKNETKRFFFFHLMGKNWMQFSLRSYNYFVTCCDIFFIQNIFHVNLELQFAIMSIRKNNVIKTLFIDCTSIWKKFQSLPRSDIFLTRSLQVVEGTLWTIEMHCNLLRHNLRYELNNLF